MQRVWVRGKESGQKPLKKPRLATGFGGVRGQGLGGWWGRDRSLGWVSGARRASFGGVLGSAVFVGGFERVSGPITAVLGSCGVGDGQWSGWEVGRWSKWEVVKEEDGGADGRGRKESGGTPLLAALWFVRAVEGWCGVAGAVGAREERGKWWGGRGLRARALDEEKVGKVEGDFVLDGRVCARGRGVGRAWGGEQVGGEGVGGQGSWLCCQSMTSREGSLSETPGTFSWRRMFMHWARW